MRATKIVATLGPASSSAEILKKLMEAGVDVVRLNFSHGTAADHQARAQLVREVSKAAGREVAIIADLQGPKIRVGKFENNKIILKAGEKFTLDANCTLGDQSKVGLDYKNLPNDVKVGDKLLLNDGLLVIRVEGVEGSCIHTIVELGGELSNNKGINRAGGGLTAPALTDKDKEDLKTAVALGADYIAISFPKNAEDMKIARGLADAASKEFGHKAKLIAKIERAEAVMPGVLEEILEVSDGIMVARGDLAVEVGNASVPALQKRMIRLAREANKVVITATQMMESMIQNPVPTRAEVSDVANAVLDGTDAVMLSAETASGKYPVNAVKAMTSIITYLEENAPVYHNLYKIEEGDPTFLSSNLILMASRLSRNVNAKAIVGITSSGFTGFRLASHRPLSNIFVFTRNHKLLTQLSLVWGVRAYHYEGQESTDGVFADIESILKKDGHVHQGDVIINTGSMPLTQKGKTNMLKVHLVG
jgi:pyruvate kinase